jgi:hypothetical protein
MKDCKRKIHKYEGDIKSEDDLDFIIPVTAEIQSKNV